MKIKTLVIILFIVISGLFIVEVNIMSINDTCIGIWIIDDSNHPSNLQIYMFNPWNSGYIICPGYGIFNFEWNVRNNNVYNIYRNNELTDVMLIELRSMISIHYGTIWYRLI